jgi:hypothetical protein
LELITGVPIVYDLDATGKIISKQILPWFFRLSPPPLSRLSLIGIFLNNFVSKHYNPYPELISVFSLSVRVSTKNKLLGLF